MVKNPFRSYWMAGYECADHLNSFGNRVNFLKITDHLGQIDEDYRALALLNIKTVREGISWSEVEKQPYVYDWTSVKTIITAGKKHGIQQIWDICHFGFPDDLTPLHPMFARRFTAVCVAFVKLYRSLDPSSELIITPINEVSFLSWLGGEVRGTLPYCTGNGWEVKYALMRAYIEAVREVRGLEEQVLIMPTEPLVNIVPPLPATDDEILHAATVHLEQFQVMDMLTGRICPELGGMPDYIDIVGCNYYYNNQWIVGTFNFLPWANEDHDSRWKPLSELIEEVQVRYSLPCVLTETSHTGEHRPQWLQFVNDECEKLLAKNIPFWGICWYPIIDRPDWDHPENWHHAGIWELDGDDLLLTRKVHVETAEALREIQRNAVALSGDK